MSAERERADLVMKIAHEVDCIPGISVAGVGKVRERLERTSLSVLRDIWASREEWRDCLTRSLFA